jgi:hypothetical protein
MMDKQYTIRAVVLDPDGSEVFKMEVFAWKNDLFEPGHATPGSEAVVSRLFNEAKRLRENGNETFWVVERFEDGNARSLGYWTGHNSRDFTPNIIDAMQFCRKEDALLAKAPWHWKDCDATEHKWLPS